MTYGSRTQSEASRMLADYEAINRDLPRSTRHQLAIFVLAPKTGSEALEALFDRPLGQTPFRHRSWMWYTAIRTSGLEPHWDEFVGRFNDGISLHDCLVRLRRRASEDEWETLSRRLGVPAFKKSRNLLNPYWWKPHPPKDRTEYWTRGGTWGRRNNYCKILVLGQHLPTRDHFYNAVSEALTPADCETLERELHNLIDPDSLLVPHAIRKAVDYARTRIPDILGYKRPTTGYKTVAWFFQDDVPHPDGGFVCLDSEVNYPVRRTDGDGTTEDWSWLP